MQFEVVNVYNFFSIFLLQTSKKKAGSIKNKPKIVKGKKPKSKKT